jgi:trk system potassium uptake protein TrkH
MVRLLKFIALTTLAVEAVGMVLLYLTLSPHRGHSWYTLYAALFHSVSAFCNAGFSLFSTSFEEYHHLLGVNVVVCGLIILGGLGFPVLLDLSLLGTRRRLGAGRSPRLRTQTKVVLTTSAVLLAVGTVVFYVTESRHILEEAGTGRRLLVSFFQSVTARTAGFNTVRIGDLAPATLVLLMFLMFIGASPGSTGGGVKTTTAAVLWQAMWAGFRRRGQTECYQRTVPAETVRRAVGLVVLSVLAIAIWLIALLATETLTDTLKFQDVAFEAFSAFGTVGLSTGATSQLSDPGRLLVTALMFIGRLGPLTLAFSLLGERRPAAYAYPEERIMVG